MAIGSRGHEPSHVLHLSKVRDGVIYFFHYCFFVPLMGAVLAVEAVDVC